MFQDHRFSIRKILCFTSILLAGGWGAYATFYANLPNEIVRMWTTVGVGSFAVLIAAFYWKWKIKPSNHRAWRPDNSKLATMVPVGDNEIEIQNVRNFHYSGKDDFEVNYETRRFDLNKIKSVDFAVSYWGPGKGKTKFAHTFLSFGFSDDKFFSVSIEVRREVDENFNPFLAMFRQYELIYIVGDERDIIGRRIHQRREVVYLYPSVANPQQARALLIDMLKQANAVAETPVFYHTMLRNCTTTLVEHLNAALKTRISHTRMLFLNGLSDRFAYQKRYLQSELPFETLKDACLVNADYIEKDDNFSKIIRERRALALAEGK